MKKIILIFLNALILVAFGMQSSCNQKGRVINADSPKFKYEQKTTDSIINSDKNVDVQNSYNGIYIFNDDACDLKIKIASSKYYIQLKNKNLAGILEILESNNDTFLIFKGFSGDDSLSEVRGLFQDSTITIQNYGNAMNPFTVFNECTSKYLVLKKENGNQTIFTK